MRDACLFEMHLKLIKFDSIAYLMRPIFLVFKTLEIQGKVCVELTENLASALWLLLFFAGETNRKSLEAMMSFESSI